MADSFLDTVRSALNPRYDVQREIGRGGMAAVFVAADRKHRRNVAVKVLLPELAMAVSSQRFLREIDIAVRLQHPNILPVFDSGEVDGLLYFVMPWVEGATLRARLEKERQLSLEEAVRITCEVAEALDYAHKQGVVHRDIKPENILFLSSHAMVADFGIARTLDPDAESKLTGTGLLLGTPRYMSPEQTTERVDQRTDVYSLGCVLYEMVAGHAPFDGDSFSEIIARHALDPVPSIRATRNGVPEVLERVILKALAKQPVDRFSSAAHFGKALRAAASGASISRDDWPAPDADRTAIAVLPLLNLSGNPENEYFCDGMTDEIINALARMPQVRVAARTSTFAYKGRQESIRTIGDELHVNTVLEGSVRMGGNRLRINAKLVKVSDGYHVWSGTYDREMHDVFAMQDELAQAIADALQVRIAEGSGTSIIKRGTSDLEAYHLYLRGRHFWYARNLPKAIEAFEAAIARDPDYSLAHSGVADAYCVLAHYGFLPSKRTSDKASDSARRAVAIDATLPETHCSLGLTHTYFGWDFREAEREFRKSLSLNPSTGLAHGWLGILYGWAGKYEQAIAEANRAVEDEPLSPLLNCIVCISHFYSREFDQAIRACETALEVAPTFGPAKWCLSLPLTYLGRHDESIQALQQSLALMNKSPWVAMMLGGAYARAGRVAEADEVVRELKQRAEREFIPALCFAWIYLNLGETDVAYEWMRKAFLDRNAMAWFFAGWPGMEWMHADPRWNALLDEFGIIPVGTENLTLARVPLHARSFGDSHADSGAQQLPHSGGFTSAAAGPTG